MEDVEPYMWVTACHSIDTIIYRSLLMDIGSREAIDVGRLSCDRDVDVGDGSEVGLMSHGIHIGISSGGTVDVPMIELTTLDKNKDQQTSLVNNKGNENGDN